MHRDLHVHVIPIHEEGESAPPAAAFSWTAGVWLYDPGEAEQLAQELRAGWPAHVHSARIKSGSASNGTR